MNAGATSLSIGTPIAEYGIDEALVLRLLRDQHADLAHLPLRMVDAGWDNAMCRLGEHLAVRLPRRAAAARLIAHDTPQIEHIWEAAVNAPLDAGATWLHGDLHPRNVLVEEGVITGIIDWGDMTAGDCATDLASLWTLFAEPSARQAALAAYAGLSEATLLRAKGWAVLFGVMFLDRGLVDNPRNAVIGERILRRITSVTINSRVT